MQQSDKIIKILNHEEFLKKNFHKYRLIGFFAKNGKLWEDLSFYINIAINIFILFSFSDKLYNENSLPSNASEDQ